MADERPPLGFPTADSFVNAEARLGVGPGTDNIASHGSYSLNPISRNRILCDWLYRGSWLAKQGVGAIPEDMTRAGITINSTMAAGDIDKLQNRLVRRKIWHQLEQTMRWARLYGGCVGMLMIEGQDPKTPLRLETIGRGQFKGILPLDRWMVNPTTSDLVTEYGPDFGWPKYYRTTSASLIPAMDIHHSRVIRFDGEELPFWQRVTENMWGLSILEPFYDRLVAFDSTTQGAAQLVYKAHVRTLKMPNLREAIAAGGDAVDAVASSLQFIRKFQSNEGLTVIDAGDELETNTYTFAGLDLVLIQFAQQLSGALQIPLTRLFGQSPAGMNATGESDVRQYYDAIAARQTTHLEAAVALLLDLECRSGFGMPPPEDFSFDFVPLWQMTPLERVQVAETAGRTIGAAVSDGLLNRATAMEELRGLSRETGLFGSITDEDIEEARAEPPPMGEILPGVPGVGGVDPGAEADPASNVIKLPVPAPRHDYSFAPRKVWPDQSRYIRLR